MNRKRIIIGIICLICNFVSFANGTKDSILAKLIPALNQRIKDNNSKMQNGDTRSVNYFINITIDEQLKATCEQEPLKQVQGADKNGMPVGFALQTEEVADIKAKMLDLNTRYPDAHYFLVLLNYIPYESYSNVTGYNTVAAAEAIKTGSGNIAIQNKVVRESVMTPTDISNKIKSAQLTELTACIGDSKPIRLLLVEKFIGFEAFYNTDSTNNGAGIIYSLTPETRLKTGYVNETAHSFNFLDDANGSIFQILNYSAASFTKTPGSFDERTAFRETLIHDLDYGVEKLEKICSFLKARDLVRSGLTNLTEQAKQVILQHKGIPASYGVSCFNNALATQLREQTEKVTGLFDLLEECDNYTLSTEISLSQRISLLKVLSAYRISYPNCEITTTGATFSRLAGKYQDLIERLMQYTPESQRDELKKALTQKNNPEYYNQLCANTVGGGAVSLLYCLYDNVTDNGEIDYTRFIMAFRKLITGNEGLEAYINSIKTQLGQPTFDPKKEVYIVNKEGQKIITDEHEVLDPCPICDNWEYEYGYPKGIIKLRAVLNRDGSVTVTQKTGNGIDETLMNAVQLYEDPSKIVYFKMQDNVALLTDFFNMYKQGLTSEIKQGADSLATVPVLALVYATDKIKRQGENENAIAAMNIVRLIFDGVAIVLPVARIGSLGSMAVRELFVYLAFDLGIAASAINDMANLFTNETWKQAHPGWNNFFELYNKIILVSCLANIAKNTAGTMIREWTANKEIIIENTRKLITEYELLVKQGKFADNYLNALGENERNYIKLLQKSLVELRAKAETVLGKNFWLSNVAEFNNIQNQQIRELAKFLYRKKLPQSTEKLFKYLSDNSLLIDNTNIANPVLKINYTGNNSITGSVRQAQVFNDVPAFKNGASVLTNESLLLCIQNDGKIAVKAGFCFTAGTPVATQYGSKPIEAIETGDSVVTFDVEKKQNRLQRVMQVLRKKASSLCRIFVQGDTLNVTSEHPFYTAGGNWTPAGKLKKGMQLLTLAGLLAPVDSVATYNTGPVTVYNFSVSHNHNYYAGKTGYLTHNTDLCKEYAARFAEKLGTAYSDELNGTLNSLFGKLSYYKLTDEKAIQFVDDLALLGRNDELYKQSLTSFVKNSLNETVQGKKLFEWLAEQGANSPGLAKELAENNLFAKWVEVMKTPAKASDEFIFCVNTGFNVKAPGYFSFLKNNLTGSGKSLNEIVNTVRANFPATWKFNKIGDDLYEVVDRAGTKWASITNNKITAPARRAIGIPGNPVLNKVPLARNITYDVDGIIYQTDELGRVLETNADIDNVVRVRLGNQQIRAVDVKDGVRGIDQGGHIVGSRFFGPGEQINLYPMSANLNLGSWKQMENAWADAMVAGKDVKIKVKALYQGISNRPIKFEVEYLIDGQPFKRTFDNL